MYIFFQRVEFVVCGLWFVAYLFYTQSLSFRSETKALNAINEVRRVRCFKDERYVSLYPKSDFYGYLIILILNLDVKYVFITIDCCI